MINNIIGMINTLYWGIEKVVIIHQFIELAKDFLANFSI